MRESSSPEGPNLQSAAPTHAAPPERPPFDPRTLLIGVWLRRRLLAACLFLGLLGGITGATFLGSTVYESETLVLYQPEGKKADPYTVVGTIKTKDNLEETGRRVGVNWSEGQLREALTVEVRRGTDLIAIRARAQSPTVAAALANGLREVLVVSTEMRRKAQLSSEIEAFKARLQRVGPALREADRKLEGFSLRHRIVKFEDDIRFSLEELRALNAMVEQAVSEQRRCDLQTANLSRVVADLQARVRSEMSQMEQDQTRLAARLESVQEVSTRMDQLRKAIAEDKARRVGLAELRRSEENKERMERLAERGLVPRAEAEKARNEYLRLQMLHRDSPQVAAWQAELERLSTAVLPSQSRFDSTPASQPLLREMLIKRFNLELEAIAAREKVKQVTHSRDLVRARVRELTSIRTEYEERTRAIENLTAEQRTLTEQLASHQRQFESQRPDFVLVSEGLVPAMPLHSNRLWLPLTISFFGLLLGVGLVVGLELADTTLRSGAEVPLRLNIPLLGVLPRLSPEHQPFPGKMETELVEPFSMIARRIRHLVPKHGARVLFVSARHHEGKTWILGNVAACLGRQGERVLLVETQAQLVDDQYTLRDLIIKGQGAVTSLTTYLASEHHKLTEIICPTILEGVDCLAQAEKVLNPDLMASSKMKRLLDEVSSHYGLVLMDGPPILPYVDGEFLAQRSDAVVFVILSKHCHAATLSKAVERIRATGVPILGAILNGVETAYLESA